MFGPLGAQELIFILILALVIFGPRQLPKIGRTIGRSMAEFRKASAELKRTFNAEMIEEEIRESDRLMRQGVDDKPRPPAREKPVREAVADAVDEEQADAPDGGVPDEASPDRDGTGTDDATVARGSAMLDPTPAEPGERAEKPATDANKATAPDGGRSDGAS